MDLLPGPKIEVSQEIPAGLKKKRNIANVFLGSS